MSKVALVTGGTRGIGAAIATALQRDGYRVAAVYASNEAAAQAFQAASGIPVYRWDVADYAACADGVARVERELGPVEVLVNNAGITRDGMFHKMTPEQWRAVTGTNLDSAFNMSRQVINGMRDRGWGRIVCISSINAQKGQLGQANYAASKAGLIGFAKALALENASKGVTVNVVCPGYIATDMVNAMAPAVVAQKILPQIPVGRLGAPDEIGRCVSFLVSEQAGFITGATLSANGGQYLA